jgi:nickel transport protein
MCRRFLVVTLALVYVLGPVGAARAHRLKAACRFFPGRMVRVETWFDNGDTPRAGDVEVSRPGGELLVKGRLSNQGLFLFDAPEVEALQVVVEAGEGHRAEVAIRSEDLLIAQAGDNAARPTAPSGGAAPPAPAAHEESFPLKDVLTGVGLLLAAAAFVMSLRNARSIRALRRPPPE